MRKLIKYPPPPPPPPVREQVGTQSTSVDDPHGQKWEVLDSTISICQRAGAGLHLDYTWFRCSPFPLYGFSNGNTDLIIL